MKVLTLMIITAAYNGQQQTFAVMPMPDRDACEKAVPAIAGSLIPSFPDVDVKCKGTGILSESPRPKARPSDLMVSK